MSKLEPHGAAIRILEMEIGRIKCCAGSHATTPQSRRAMLDQCAEAEKTVLFLRGQCKS